MRDCRYTISSKETNIFKELFLCRTCDEMQYQHFDGLSSISIYFYQGARSAPLQKCVYFTGITEILDSLKY